MATAYKWRSAAIKPKSVFYSIRAAVPLLLIPNKYKPQDDFYLAATPYAQTITYGSGGWAGPLINTHLQFETHERKMTLKEGHIAIIESEQQNNFYGADGILGLAYRQLNRAYNLTEYFQERNYSPEQTFPWPFAIEENKKIRSYFQKVSKELPF